jgi:hypothetical protein
VGLEARIIENEKPPFESTIFFRSASRADVIGFYLRLLASRTADMKVELVVAPAAKAADGIDLHDEVVVVFPEYITEPKP